MAKFAFSGLSKNHLLARLPADEYRSLEPHLKNLRLPVKETLYQDHGRIEYAYFPLHGVLSAMTIMTDGDAIEVATIGLEGVTGLSAFFGADISPYEVMVQVEADVVRIPVDVLKKHADGNDALKTILGLYNIALANQIGLAVACNGLHTIEKRCCRWLLMTHDRVESDVLPLTHEFLSIMLGVRRSSITEVLQPLREQGLIHNERGKIQILNRKGLEAVSCECYRRTQDEFTRLFS